MALEAIVFPQDPFVYKDLFNLVNSSSSTLNFIHDQNQDFYFDDHILPNNYNQSQNSPMLLDQQCHHNFHDESPPRVDSSTAEAVEGEMQVETSGKRRRQRGKTQKNKEEIENQRMTHIVVERNRRKQMNEYLSILRSLMPHSYVQRGDQASIIGGAINFVKELEQQVHLLSSAQTSSYVNPNNIISSSPFHFFTFPTLLSSSSSSSSSSSASSFSLDSTSVVMTSNVNNNSNNLNSQENLNSLIQSSIGDIEVSLADSHANLKIRCKKLPKQLLKVVSGLHSLHLNVLHLNVSTAHPFVLYSFSLKVEEDCGLSSVDEIANGVYQLLCRIQEEAFSI